MKEVLKCLEGEVNQHKNSIYIYIDIPCWFSLSKRSCVEFGRDFHVPTFCFFSPISWVIAADAPVVFQCAQQRESEAFSHWFQEPVWLDLPFALNVAVTKSTLIKLELATVTAVL